MEPKEKLTYKASGVDVDKGNKFVNAIKPLANKTQRSGAISELGGFGGLFDLGALAYKEPILVAATDGVGTKLILAKNADIHHTIGIDLVAMCVNDLIVQGAEPLFFSDYLSTGKLNNDQMKEIINGIVDGCIEAKCALIGGETAEMPAMYSIGEYDLAGFAVGAVERKNLLPLDNIHPNDLIVGLKSNGLHSNGFSLVRKIIEDKKIRIDEPAPFNNKVLLSSSLLTPTRIYVKSCLSVIKNFEIKALAHITGGGITENIPRVLPTGLSVQISSDTWQIPPVFNWLANTGNIDPKEMLRTFNCGIGMVIIIGQKYANEIVMHLEKCGEEASIIGKVTEKSNQSELVEILDLKETFR